MGGENNVFAQAKSSRNQTGEVSSSYQLANDRQISDQI